MFLRDRIPNVENLCEGAFMKIQAITPVSVTQPVNRVDFSKNKKVVPSIPLQSKESQVIADKYDTACLVAAYYKTQYENLLKNGCCEA